jgi:hypothetical protein
MTSSRRNTRGEQAREEDGEDGATKLLRGNHNKQNPAALQDNEAFASELRTVDL